MVCPSLPLTPELAALLDARLASGRHGSAAEALRAALLLLEREERRREAASAAFLEGGGEMGALMRAHDWAATPLGPPGAWPQSLRTTIRLALGTRHPVFVFWGPELICLYNDAFAATIGPERHPGALGRPGREVWAETWPVIGPQIEQVMSGRGATWHENHLVPITRHGRREEVWWTYSYSPIDDDTAPGGIGGVLVLCNDVTREHRAREALREGEARLRALLDALPVMVWVTDPGGRCTFLNRRWHAFTGQGEAEGLGFGWLDAVHPEDREEARRIFLAANARQEGFRLDYRLRRADGAWRWAIDAAEPHLAPDGSYLGHAGAVIDITERKEAEERQALLAREVDHRARNLLAVVQATLRLTPAGDPAGFVRAVEGRIRALARAHTLLAEDRWRGADLRALLEGELAPFLGAGRRVRLDGPPLLLPAGAAPPLAMAVHELATNAARHGALVAPEGRVSVCWQVEDGSLRLRWTEEGGPPPAAPPAARGLGTRLLDAAARRQLGGAVSLAWKPEGLVCELTVPLASPRAAAAD
ncbi:sensor histidine kinase [Crenalkalicoccus roseus]|uniref:sensor histidine kinase n=1 Tax=Crenalkalicoccus roseus TaxID=1485588 RepID=UPI001081B6CA|nr:PAS domain S-box protein [Crenalkalicoccus roseus]